MIIYTCSPNRKVTIKMKTKNKFLLGCVGLALATTCACADQTNQAALYEMIFNDTSQSNQYIRPAATNSYVQQNTTNTYIQPAVQQEQQMIYQPETKIEQPVQQQTEPVVQTPEETFTKATPTVSKTPVQVEQQVTATDNNTGVYTKEPYYNNWSIEEAQARVDAIGKKLLENSNLTDKGITFHASDEPTVNAYADGKRNVVIFSGLLELCESEDEVAFILSHEIAHIAGLHIIKGNMTRVAAKAGTKAAKKKLGGLISKTAKGLGAEKLGISSKTVDKAVENAVEVSNNAVDTAGVAAVTYHSRAHEVDADTVGMDIMKKANYNPMAGIAIMYRIGDNYNDIFVDHPSTDKRVEKMYNHASENYPEQLKAGYDSKYYKEAISIMQEEKE